MIDRLNTTPSNARPVNAPAHSVHGRRDTFAALGATVLAGIAVAGFCRPEMLAQTAHVPNPDALLLQLVAQLRTSVERFHDLCAPYYDLTEEPLVEVNAEIAQVVAINRDLRIKAANIPAHSLSGRKAKAWALLEEWGLEDAAEVPEEGDTSHLLWSLSRDVLAENA